MRPSILLPTLVFLAAPWSPASAALQSQVPSGTSTTQSTLTFNQLIKIAGQEVDTKVEVAVTSRIAAAKRGEDGKLRLALTMTASKLTITLPGGMVIKYDSAAGGDSTGMPAIDAQLDALKAFHDATYTLVLDRDNKPVAVEGGDAILARATPASQAMVKRMLRPAAVATESLQNYQALPPAGAKKGDRWQLPYVLDFGDNSMTFEMFYEHQGTIERDGRTLEKITFIAGEVTYRSEPNPQVQAQVTASELKMDSSAGMLLYDREKSLIVERTFNGKITGSMTISAGGMNLPAQLDLTLDSKDLGRLEPSK